MRPVRKLLLSLTAVAAVGAATVASAATPLFTFDENGNGTFTDPAGYSVPIPHYILPDPLNPSVSTLAYDLGIIGARVQAGDVNVYEVSQPVVVSDMLRFVDNPQNPNGSLVFVFSDNSDGAEDLADVGIPQLLQPNHSGIYESGSENGMNGLFNWSPGSNSGGYLGSPLRYTFISDVPEPSALVLLGLGGC